MGRSTRHPQGVGVNPVSFATRRNTADYGGQVVSMYKTTASGAPQGRPEAGLGHKKANGVAGWPKPAVEPGFRV